MTYGFQTSRTLRFFVSYYDSFAADFAGNFDANPTFDCLYRGHFAFDAYYVDVDSSRLGAVKRRRRSYGFYTATAGHGARGSEGSLCS